SSVSPTVDINGLEVAIGTNCIVAYDVDVKTPLNEGTNIDNQVTIFPSIEGGAGSTPGIYTISTPSSDTIIVDATPNLSTSTKVDDDADNFVDPGQTVTYTTTLINTGDGTGTGINIDDTIDTNTNGLTNFTFTDCGSSYVNSSVSPTVDINGLEVAIGTNCIVTYDITVKSSTTLGTTINNQTTISSATEGGPGATPSSDTLTSNGTVPDLSSSTKLDDDADNEVITGQLVRYTILLKNIGGQTATGVSTTDNLDSKLKNISSVALENCGSSYVDNSTSSPNIISIDDLEILNTIDCTIEFSGTVKTGYVGEIISNVVTISAAAEGGSGSTAISDNLAIANTAPDAKNDATSTNEDTAVTINVLDNDTDVDGNLNPATLAIATEPENGTVTVNNETGKINYTPDEGFVGTDTFKYQICDDDGLCDTAKVEVTVNPVEEENPSYNLNIFKVADPPNGEIVVPRNLLYPGSPGTIITYIMTVTNDSNSTVTNVVISDMIGDGMLYIPGSLVYEDVNLTDQAGDDRGDYNETELGMVTYFAGDLAPGDTRVAFFKIEVAEYSEAIPDLINKPACTSDQVICEVTSDPVVHPVDPFEVYKTVEDLNSGLVESGDKLKYTLRVVNIGHTPTTTVIVTDDLPDEITYVAGSITGLGADDSNTDILKWNIGIMAVGAEEIVTFEATVNAGVARSTVINNVGSVSSDQNTTPKVSSVETAKVITDVALAGTGSDTRPLRYTGMLLIIFGLALLGFTLYNPKEQIVQTMKVNSKKR
ncbi:MAG: Ig-like domain-containing protein, partial [bacterium]|nr:Ig-like domain-containing protein [bacterium]